VAEAERLGQHAIAEEERLKHEAALAENGSAAAGEPTEPSEAER